MNYLAHAWLSGPDEAWILGGYLGDHVRGDRWREYPTEVAAGILLHRSIDSFVDAHPAFSNARKRLEPPFRRYAGILLDMFFDHLLARQWEGIDERSLDDFARDQYQLLARNRALMPDSLRRFSDHLIANDLLARYRDKRAVSRALAGIGGRLRRDNPLHRGMQVFNQHAEALSADFKILWPDVAAHAAALRASPDEHLFHRDG